MDYMEEVYAIAQNNCGLKVGDYVKIKGTAKKGEAGWNNAWTNEMTSLVGEIGIVNSELSKDTLGITVSFINKGLYSFPFYVLEKLERPKCMFEQYQRVLVRTRKENRWRCQLFAYDTGDNGVVCMDSILYKYCIPYDGNENLANTIGDNDE